MNVMTTLLYLTRHGETEHSGADRYYGRSSSPVTPEGTVQIEKLSRRLAKLDVSAVYSSPLDRCRGAAQRIAAAHGLDVTVLESLSEIDHGLWEGLSRREVEERFPSSYACWRSDPAANGADGGESGYSVAARAVPQILGIVRAHKGRSVVVMGHNTLNRIILSHFLGLSLRNYRSLIQYPAALNCISFSEDEKATILAMNDISHWAA